MFLINTTPLPSHSQLGDYGKFLLNRFIRSQFKKGSMEVHVVFDNPGRLENTPKCFQQSHRDATATVSPNHVCAKLTENTVLQLKKWRENHLNCRTCKRNLVLFLGNYFLTYASTYLHPDQRLYVAGAFEGEISDTAWFVTDANDPQPDPLFLNNSGETDTRLWLHFKKTRHDYVLVMSPDTDVYIIGLALRSTHDKNVMVQVSKYNARELRYLSLSALRLALHHDPELAPLRDGNIELALQAIYVSTGCDYTSFFSGIGKATFLKYFLQYSSFISGSGAGTLADTSLVDNKYKVGLLAFLRLVGSVYFKKYSSGFDVQSPEAYFRSFSSLS